MFYGLHEWLSPPKPNSRCSLPLKVKKSILVALIFILMTLLGMGIFFAISRLHLVLPTLVHLVLFIVENVSFLLLIPALFFERPRLALPFIAIEGLRVLLFAGLSVYYLIKTFCAESAALDGESARHFGKVLGHVFFVTLGYLLLLFVAVSVYQRYRIGAYRDVKRGSSHQLPEHNIITLEQPIEEAMYGRKRFDN